MGLRRTFYSFLPSFIRKRTLFITILTIIITATLLWCYQSDEPYHISESICESEINQKLKNLNESGINVIPSVPKTDGTKEGNYDYEEEDDVNTNECLDIAMPGDTRDRVMICIHDPKKDLKISAYLKRDGSWEKENVEDMSRLHQRFPDMILVDLGCNIGVFTIPAAKLGMEVIAVDSMLSSLKNLQRSLGINGLSCHVTVIHNALYRKRGTMKVALDPTNVGGSMVMEIPAFRLDKVPSSQKVESICLDDLVPFVKGKDVFLKMDLEGTEVAALECAHQFFEQANVKVLLIEWMHYRHVEEHSRFLKNFLVSHHMVPTWGVDPDRVIDLEASNSWPDNLFWMKRE